MKDFREILGKYRGLKNQIQEKTGLKALRLETLVRNFTLQVIPA